MSTDRELLELAAKAIGIGHYVFCEIHMGMIPAREDDYVFPFNVWNPLTDDGDALRLAGKLEMDIYIYDTHATAANYEIMGFDEDAGNDIQKAIRRATVRVAAAIGEAMP